MNNTINNPNSHSTNEHVLNTKTLISLTFWATAATALLSFSTANAEIYKWTDAKGQIHYSATPPVKKVKTEKIGEEIRMAAGKFDPASVTQKKATSEESGDNENDNNADASSNKSGGPNKELIKYCKSQRKNLKLLQNNQNIVWRQFGKKSELTAAQRKAKIKKIKTEISEECKGV